MKFRDPTTKLSLSFYHLKLLRKLNFDWIKMRWGLYIFIIFCKLKTVKKINREFPSWVHLRCSLKTRLMTLIRNVRLSWTGFFMCWIIFNKIVWNLEIPQQNFHYLFITRCCQENFKFDWIKMRWGLYIFIIFCKLKTVKNLNRGFPSWVLPRYSPQD
jgi:hypothetical protein